MVAAQNLGLLRYSIDCIHFEEINSAQIQLLIV